MQRAPAIAGVAESLDAILPTPQIFSVRRCNRGRYWAPRRCFRLRYRQTGALSLTKLDGCPNVSVVQQALWILETRQTFLMGGRVMGDGSGRSLARGYRNSYGSISDAAYRVASG